MSLGDLETAVMEYCWMSGENDAKSVHRAIGEARQITLNTIQSTLKRLYAKGLLVRQKVSHAHVYAPRISREEFQRHVLAEIATGLSRSETAGMLAAFVDLAERAGEETLERLERLVAERLRARGRQ
ncbi:MAG: BlaI/MecI/CopY family transcriptional regulator [Candidatus Binatia bacterium]